MEPFSLVEQKYSFTLPSAYRSFAERGYVNYPGEDCLWLHEAEWLPPTEMLDQGGLSGNPKPGLVAFAFTGGGDLWAWQTKRKSADGEPMIAFCPRDSYSSWWHAPSFLGWLYRLSLEYASTMWDEEVETKRNVNRWAKVLRDFGQAEWADIVRSVASRDIVVVKSEGWRKQHFLNKLITEDEVNNRVFTAFGPGFIDSPYVWDLEGEQA